jgi:flagellar M-ring protein FliF
MATGTQLEKSPLPVPPLNERLNGAWKRAQLYWQGLESTRRNWTLVAGILILATLGALIWYGTRTDWRLLMTNLDPEDARSVAAALTQAQIPYELAENGMAIRVPAANLDKARLATVAKGALKSGRMGFELFDKPNWVGSEFDEQVNYQRALEGELEHTVGSLSDVRAARVHLVMPHDSLFREQERPAKASVVLQLRHRALEEGEPDAIRNLVASAVDGLTPERVVLVDADGRAELGPKTADAERLRAEQALEEKLLATLEPVTGAGNVRASVTLDYDPAAVEETAESYDPDQTVTLSMQRSEQTTGPQAIPAGVPGTASNAPNAQSTPVYPQQQTPPASSKSEASTYGSSKMMRHSVQGAGRIRRLTAAILVNDRLASAADKNKPAVWQARSADDLKHLTALAEAAIGFDPARGDRVTVEDLGFEGNAGHLPATWYEKFLNSAESSPQLLKFLALTFGFMILVAFGIRPAVARSMKTVHGNQKALPKSAGANVLAAEEEPRELTAEELERQRTQKVFDQVAEHLKREPNQSSRLLQSWIHSD